MLGVGGSCDIQMETSDRQMDLWAKCSGEIPGLRTDFSKATIES